VATCWRSHKNNRRHGFQLALDDFGAGYSGLNLLADLTPDIVKLAMDLTRNLHQRPVARTIIQSTLQLCKDLGVLCIAEGVETVEELKALRSCGIRLMQGYLLARPTFESLPAFTLPEASTGSSIEQSAKIALSA
jgi:EAL domain-containing protein (putative c-di-GMP-specific phosphodiesterase class I)